MADLEEPDDSSSKFDNVAIYHASFMKCALLLRDTNDAYKMGDGDRVLSNSKFQMLLSRAGNHSKYQLWLFRYMANCLCLLTPRMAYEYKWNCSANLQGGLGNNIPCDNLVELLEQTVKKLCMHKVPTQHSQASKKPHLPSKSKMKSRTIFKTNATKNKVERNAHPYQN